MHFEVIREALYKPYYIDLDITLASSSFKFDNMFGAKDLMTGGPCSRGASN